MSVSKYFLNKRAEEFQCHIRETSDWPFMMKDPVFVTISVDCGTVPIKELVSRRNKLFEHHRVKTPEVPDAIEEPVDDEYPSERSEESDYDASRRGSMSSRSGDYVAEQGTNAEEYPGPITGARYDDEGEYDELGARREPRNGSHNDQTPDSSHG